MIGFLWELKIGKTLNTKFEGIDIKNINYISNALFSRKIFSILETSLEKKIFSKKMNLLLDKEPMFKEWFSDMISNESNFKKILKLNFIKEKAKPLH